MDQAVARLLKSDDNDHIFYQVLGQRGEFVAGDADLPVPLDPPTGAADVRFRDDVVRDETVRVAFHLAAARRGQRPRPAGADRRDAGQALAPGHRDHQGVILPQFIILPLASWCGWRAGTRHPPAG